MNEADFTVFDDVSALQVNVAEAIASLIRVTAERNGQCNIALSGGGTPKRIYELLVDLDWPREAAHWFWGDERNVPPGDDDSNYNMVHAALLQPADVPPSHVHRVPIDEGETDNPATISQQYEDVLKSHFGSHDWPAFDLVLLGMGDDAHTASLFPYTKAIDESSRWFVENWVEKLDTYRYTLTADAINSGSEIWFLIAGANKREALRAVREGGRDVQTYPSQLIRPTRVFVTADAAGTSAMGG